MSDHPVRLLITDDLRRSRLTVGLRLLLAIPHSIWLGLWSVVVLLASVLNWLATLVLGRSPAPFHHFIAAYVKYATQFFAYVRLAANPYPSFDGPDGYPIDLAIAPAATQSRWKTLLRFPLALPALVLAAVMSGDTGFALNSGTVTARLTQSGLAGTIALFAWFVCVARRRMPRGMRDAIAWTLAYGAQLWAYLLLLTDRYPDSDPLVAVPGLPERDDPISVRGEDDLRRSRLTVFFRLPLSFPHFVWLFLWQIVVIPVLVLNWLATLTRGRPPERLHGFLAAFLRYRVSVYAFFSLVANPFPGFGGAAGSYPLDTVIAPPGPQNRWTVLFRLFLAVPAIVIGSVLSTLGSIVAILSWFSALIRGRVPRGLRNSGAMIIRYQAQITGYLLLLTSSYPYTGPVLSDGCGPSGPVDAGPSGPVGGETP